ncbi:MAG TPA: ADOP family duplicated permease, partial [Vicinamibacterales bacterium]
MNWHHEIRSEFTRLNKIVDDTVVEELAQHAAAAFEAARAGGESSADAEARVRALITSWCEGTIGPQRIVRPPLVQSVPAGRSWFAGLGLDLRLSVRLLWRQPGFAVLSIAMIALGIAATTSIFSVVNGVVLKPLPMPGAEGLVRLMEAGALQSGATTISNLTYNTWIPSTSSGQASQAATIEGIGTWSPEHSVELDGPNGATQVRYSIVSPSLFPLLRAAPLIGRHFSEARKPVDEAFWGERRYATEVILSYGFWQERFGGAPDVLGKKLDLAPWPRSPIVGIMPQGFEWPSSAARLWVRSRDPGPVVNHGVGKNGRQRTMFGFTEFNAVARLKPGFTAEQAAAEATSRVNAPGGEFADARQRMFGGDGTARIRVVPLLEWSLQDVQPALWMLLAAVGLLFAAAVGNLVNLQLTRAAKRQQEVAVRAAIGAGGARLARQLLVETLPIAVIGGTLGVAITAAVLRMLPALLPANFPRAQEVVLDGRVLGVAIALTFIVAILAGLLPVRLARRLTLTSGLAEGSTSAGSNLRSPRGAVRPIIIAGQVAVAALLLVGAALLGQSFLRMVAVDRGYELANVLTAHLSYHPLKATHGSFRPFYDRFLSYLPSMPGVTHAGIASRLPLLAAAGRSVEVSERAAPTRRMPAMSQLVSADYFNAMGMRVTRGRGFTREDVYGSEQVMLVNETFAARYLPGDPLNVILHAPFHSVGSEFGPDSLFRIVGVVADVKGQGPADPVEPEIYANYTQFGKLGEGPGESQFLAVRTTGNPGALARDLQQFVSSLSPWASLENVMTMEARVERTLARPRLYATLVSGFAAFAVIVAVIGLFGGLSYSVAQRTREIGVRSALGATPGNILALVLRQGIVLGVAGLAIGLGAAAASGRYLSAHLFGVTAS